MLMTANLLQQDSSHAQNGARSAKDYSADSRGLANGHGPPAAQRGSSGGSETGAVAQYEGAGVHGGSRQSAAASGSYDGGAAASRDGTGGRRSTYDAGSPAPTSLPQHIEIDASDSAAIASVSLVDNDGTSGVGLAAAAAVAAAAARAWAAAATNQRQQVQQQRQTSGLRSVSGSDLSAAQDVHLPETGSMGRLSTQGTVSGQVRNHAIYVCGHNASSTECNRGRLACEGTCQPYRAHQYGTMQARHAKHYARTGQTVPPCSVRTLTW